ncbi:hypothetical protein GW17_00005676 [Ensete ventricosum]|nr:hypothetical protein GW17_00005676 [Ensete ventricosum]
MVSAWQSRGFKRASRGVVPLGSSLFCQMESMPHDWKMWSTVLGSPRRWFTTASEWSKEHHSPRTDKDPVLHFFPTPFPHTLSLPPTRSKDPTGPIFEDSITKPPSDGIGSVFHACRFHAALGFHLDTVVL